jgi:hypothetical protein
MFKPSLTEPNILRAKSRFWQDSESYRRFHFLRKFNGFVCCGEGRRDDSVAHFWAANRLRTLSITPRGAKPGNGSATGFQAVKFGEPHDAVDDLYLFEPVAKIRGHVNHPLL